MENKIVLVVMLTSLIVCCTNEYTEDKEIFDGSLIEIKSKETARLLQSLNPENPANTYDIAGKIHNEILDVYLAGNYPYYTIDEISQTVDSISVVNYNLLNLETNFPIDFQEIQETVDDPQIKLEQTIANAPMTNNAKICLSNFMASILLWETNEYAVIHQTIISFETSVISNTEFSNEDKRIILTSSAITRYSFYYTIERKDKEWESTIGNRVGAVVGAVNNAATAINKSIVTGLLILSVPTK